MSEGDKNSILNLPLVAYFPVESYLQILETEVKMMRKVIQLRDTISVGTSVVCVIDMITLLGKSHRGWA